ncbi:MAG: peptidoglycan DD-metalloendopeptidase family protein [Flavobacteriales bacterium]
MGDDTLDIYQDYWSNSDLFPCAVGVRIPEEGVVLELTDSSHRFTMPRWDRINSYFGWRNKGEGYYRPHNGLDIHLSRGDSVVAAFDGFVRFADYNDGGYGNLVIIRHLNGLETYYAHLDALNVAPNQYVQSGELIGYGGDTGSETTGVHLHFEVRFMDKPLDPLQLISFSEGRLRGNFLLIDQSTFGMNKDDDGQWMSSREISEAKRKSASRQDQAFHTVGPADSLARIAGRYGVSIAQLCEWNNINRSSPLLVGQKIRIKP